MKSNCPWMWLCLGLLSACGGDDDDDSAAGACGLEDALEGTALDELGKLGSISVHEQPIDGGPVERFATGSFLDFSAYEANDAPTVQFDLVCSSIVGIPETITPPTRLLAPAATLTIDGQAAALEEVGDGQLRADALAAIDAGATVGLDVVGGDGATEFPSFAAELQAPAAPGNLSATRDSGGALIVKWDVASAEALEIELRVTGGEDNTRIRCIVADDGCLTITSAAVSWLTQSLDPVPMDLRVSATRSTQWTGPNDEIGFFKVERRRDVSYAP